MAISNFSRENLRVLGSCSIAFHFFLSRFFKLHLYHFFCLVLMQIIICLKGLCFFLKPILPCFFLSYYNIIHCDDHSLSQCDCANLFYTTRELLIIATTRLVLVVFPKHIYVQNFLSKSLLVHIYSDLFNYTFLCQLLSRVHVNLFVFKHHIYCKQIIFIAKNPKLD